MKNPLKFIQEVKQEAFRVTWPTGKETLQGTLMVVAMAIVASLFFLLLDQFLKFRGIVQTGGEAKMIIKSGKISVNGMVEKRRGRKLIDGDQISFANETYIVPNSDPLGRKLARSEK